jgi:predicted SprT family Zn-dependent metalloprotease
MEVAKIKAVEQAVFHACSVYEVPNPPIRWSRGMTSAAGKASRKEVVFSIPLFLTGDIAFCLETAVHEAAHYIEFQKFGTSSHGARWKGIMKTLGYPNAQRCHQQDRSHLANYQLICKSCQKVLRDYTKQPTLSLYNKISKCCNSKLEIRDIKGKPIEIAPQSDASFALKCNSCEQTLKLYTKKPMLRLDNKISKCCRAKIKIEKL